MIKFVKGVMIGSIVSAGMILWYNENTNKNKMMKKGKRILKNIGM